MCLKCINWMIKRELMKMLYYRFWFTFTKSFVMNIVPFQRAYITEGSHGSEPWYNSTQHPPAARKASVGDCCKCAWRYCQGSWRNGSFIYFMLLKTNCKQCLATIITVESMHPYNPTMHFSILAFRTPWKVWKEKKIWHWKMNSPGQ